MEHLAGVRFREHDAIVVWLEGAVAFFLLEEIALFTF